MSAPFASPAGPADDRPLRILFPYDGTTFGGSHVSSLLLAQALKARGHEPVVVSHGEGRVLDEAVRLGLAVVRLPALWRRRPRRGSDRLRPGHLLGWGAALGALESLAPDLAHLNDLAMLRVWAGPARFAGVPFIKHWRSRYKGGLAVDLALRGAARVIAVSRRSRDELPAWAAARSVVEYNPIAPIASPRLSIEEAKAAVGLDPQARVLGVFGALSWRKRPHVLAEVLGRLPRMIGGRPVVGVAAGEPFSPGDPALATAIANFGLQHRLLMPGFVRPVEPWISACDVVLVPAVNEPFGRTPLEALACGRPAIVSQDCGAAEVLTSNGDAILLPPEPIGAWVSETGALLADDRRARALVQAGLATVAQLGPAAHAARVEAVYRSVLAPRGRASAAGGEAEAPPAAND